MTSYADRWLIVRKTRKIPGGWRVVKSLGSCGQESAESIARRYYKGSARAMSERELIDIRTAALASEKATS